MACHFCMAAWTEHRLALRTVFARLVAQHRGLARRIVPDELRVLAILFGAHAFSLAVFRDRFAFPLAAFFAGVGSASVVTDCAGFFFI